MSFNPNFPGDAGASFPFFGVKPKNYIGFPQYTEVSYPQFNQVQYPSFNSVGYPQQPKFPTFRNPTPYGGPLGINNATMINNMNKSKPQWNAFTDPYAINSLSDVLFNSTAKNKRYGIEHAWLTKTTKALFDYTNEQFIQPFKKDGGGVNQVIVNSLHSISEDFALLRNPMKGAIVEADSQKASGIIGVGAAVLGGAAVALSGPVGWGAVITGGLAAGGAAAVGTAFAKDPSAAFRGIKKGFGVGGEERTSYDFTTASGENPNFFINLIANIALDPMLWVGAAGNMLESNVNKSMQAFLGRSQALGTHRPEISELYKMADTLTDKLFVGTEALKRADSIYTKAVTLGNPLGLTWVATKTGGKYVVNQLQQMKEMSSTIEKAYPEITKIQNIDKADAFIKTRVDDAETLERIRYNVGRIVDEDKIIFKSVSGEDIVANSKDLVSFADKLPKDLSPLRAFADERATFYMEQGIKGDKFTRLLQLDLEELLLRGTVDEVSRSASADAALNFLKNIPADTPQEVIDVLVNDLMVTEAYRTMATEGLKTGAVKMLNEVNRKLPMNATKLEVMDSIEKEMATVMGFSPGTSLAESFLMLSASESDLVGYYDPLLKTIESILNSHNIPLSEFKEFIAKDTGAIEKLIGYTAETSIRPNVFLNPKEYALVPFGSQEVLREIAVKNADSLKNVGIDEIVRVTQTAKPIKVVLSDYQTYSQLHLALRNMLTVVDTPVDDNLLNYTFNALENPREFMNMKPPRVAEFSSGMQKDIQEFIDTLYTGKKDHTILTDKAKTAFGSDVLRIDEILELSTRNVLFQDTTGITDMTDDLYRRVRESVNYISKINPDMPDFSKELDKLRAPIEEVSRHKNILSYVDNTMRAYENTLKFKDFKGLEKTKETDFDRYRYEERIERIKEALSKVDDLMPQDLQEIAYLEEILSELRTDPEILNDYAASVKILESTYYNFISSMPYHSQINEEQEMMVKDAVDAIESLKGIFGGHIDDVPSMPFAELPKHKYYTLQMSKTGQMAALSNVILDKHSSFMDDLFVNHGEMRAVFDTLYEIDYGGTYLEHVYTAAREIENRLMGVRNYTDLWGAVGKIVNDHGLDPKYEYAVMDVITNFSTVDPKRFLEMVKDPTSEVIRLLENTLAMVGLDPTKMTLFMPILREFAGNMAAMDVDSVIYIPGTDFNRTVERFKTGIIPEFFAGADEFDDAMTAFVDLSTMSDDVYEMVARMADTQRYAQQYAVHNEHTASMRRKLATSPIVGARDLQTLSKKQQEAEDYKSRDIVSAAKGRHSQHMANEIFRLQSKKGAAPLYADVDLALSDYTFNASILNSLANTDIALMSDIGIDGLDMSKNGFNAYYNLLRSNADTLIEAQLFLDSFPDIDYLEKFAEVEVGKKRASVRAAELRRSDPFFARNGVSKMNALKADAYTKLPAEDIAREIKFNSTSGFKFIQRSLIKEGLSPEVHQELARYGIVAGPTKTGSGYIIKKVLDTKEFDSLEPGTTQYNTEGHENSIMKSSSYDAYVRLDKYNRKQLGVHSVFGPDLHLPIRIQADAVDQFFMLNPDIVADIGGIEVAEEFLSKTYRSRGYESDFIGDHSFMSMFVGRDPKSGNSYLPDTVFNTIYNTTLGLIDHNNTKQRLMAMVDKSQYRVNDIFKNSSAKEVAEAFKHNPNFVGVYFKPNGKVRKIKLDNEKAVELAFRENLMVVDGSTYSEMHKAFNNRNLQESGVLGNLLYQYEKNVKPLFIASAMASVGAPVRNMSDTIIKNISVSGDPEAVLDIQRAKKMIDEYSQMARDLKGDVTTEYKVDKWFRDKYPDKVEYAKAKGDWYMVYEFLTSNASAGRLEAEADRMRRGLDDAGNIVKKKFGDDGIIRGISFDNPILKPLFTAYSNVEMVSRLGLFLTMKRQGVDTPTAMQIVVDTHYDYTTRSDAELLLNDVIPFSTFPLRNFLWWADHAFDHPVLMRQFFSTAVESWTHDDLSAKKLADPEDSYAKFMMMSGNPLERRNAYSTVMKLNPSFFDALTYVPKWIMDPKQKLAGPIKNMELIGKSLAGTLPEELDKEGKPKSLLDRMEIPFRMQFERGSKILKETIPKALSGEDEDLRFGAEIIPSLFSVYKYEPKEYTKALNNYTPKRYTNPYYNKQYSSRPYIPYAKDYGRYPSRPAYYKGPKKAHHPYPKFGTPSQYTAKGDGNRALSTGFVTKSGKFRSSGGLGYGNPQYTRDMNMGIAFGRYGAYLQNAPQGVKLRRLDYFDRSLYAKHYSQSGNSRLINRTKKLTDTKSLAFRLQDMRYNMF